VTLRFRRMGMGVGVGRDGEVDGPVPSDERSELLRPGHPAVQRYLDEDRVNPAIALGVLAGEQSRLQVESAKHEVSALLEPLSPRDRRSVVTRLAAQFDEKRSEVASAAYRYEQARLAYRASEEASEAKQKEFFDYLIDELVERTVARGRDAKVNSEDFVEVTEAFLPFLRKVREGTVKGNATSEIQKNLRSAELLEHWVRQVRDLKGIDLDPEAPRVFEPGEVQRLLDGIAAVTKVGAPLTPKVVASLEKARAAAREVPMPPANSPANYEVLAMSAAHYYGALDFLTPGEEDIMMLDFSALDLSKVPEADRATYRASRVLGQVLAGPVPQVVITDASGKLIAVDVEDADPDVLAADGRSLPVSSDGFRAFRPHPAIRAFLAEWRRSSYARLEVGHRLAASLALTDVPDDAEVRAPWEAWSLVVPDGLLGNVARAWCVGTEVVAVISRPYVVSVIGDDRSPQPSRVTLDMIRSLVVGACLALSDPEAFRKERQGAGAGQRRRRHSGPPDLDQARYLLSAPVTVDLRDHVRAALDDERAGRRVSSPKVQFLVRGHWKNQAHGPRHSLRRRQWQRPFWKGPEDTRVLLRAHRVEEP
jgi:hypothetical protein